MLADYYTESSPVETVVQSNTSLVSSFILVVLSSHQKLVNFSFSESWRTTLTLDMNANMSSAKQICYSQAFTYQY